MRPQEPTFTLGTGVTSRVGSKTYWPRFLDGAKEYHMHGARGAQSSSPKEREGR